MCRSTKPVKRKRVSLLEKSPGYSRKNSQTLKFAVVTRNNFFRADDQSNEVSGKKRPSAAAGAKYHLATTHDQYVIDF